MRGALRLYLLLVGALSSAAATTGSCPKYQGKTCAGHGVCTDAEGGPVCSCEAGFTQSDCAFADHCPNDCSGQGTCVQPPLAIKRLDPLKLGTCACNAGFGGEQCTRLVGRADQLSLAATVAVPAAGCDGFCSGHGTCKCGPPERKTVQKLVRTFDERGRAGEDALINEEVRAAAPRTQRAPRGTRPHPPVSLSLPPRR